MRSVRRSAITLALLVALTSLPRMQDAVPPRAGAIVIDPGHGGDDTGARGAGGLLEKQFALEIALRVRSLLEAQPWLRVVLTRDGDRAVTFDERASIANAAQADLLLSLHANTAPAASVSGAEVYYSALEPAPGDLLPVGDEPLTLLPWEDAQARQFDASARAAALVQEELQRLGPMRPPPIRQAPLRMFRGAAMPAVLVELLFLSNPDQEAAAATPELKDALATALAASISRFLARPDSPLLP